MRKKKTWFKLLPAVGMVALVVAAIATPSAAAVDLMPDGRAGALALIVPVAVLMVAMVVEVWRHTGRQAVPAIEREIADKRARRRNARTH